MSDLIVTSSEGRASTMAYKRLSNRQETALREWADRQTYPNLEIRAVGTDEGGTEMTVIATDVPMGDYLTNVSPGSEPVIRLPEPGLDEARAEWLRLTGTKPSIDSVPGKRAWTLGIPER